MMLAEATGFDLGARTRRAAHGGGRRDARLRHADRRRRLEVQLLRPPGVAGARRRAEDARGRAAHPRADPAGVRGRRAGRDRRRSATRQLTFVVVGAGPTGVEMAGQIAEIARDTRRDFRNIDTAHDARAAGRGRRPRARGVPAEALQAGGELAARASASTPLLNRDGHRHRRRRRDDAATAAGVSSATVIWAAGVLAAGVSSALAEASGAETDRVGRLLVEPDLSLPGPPRGARDRRHGPGARRRTRCPASRPVAMQMGRYAAKLVKGRLRGAGRRPVQVQGQGQPGDDRPRRAPSPSCRRGIRVSGFPAWALWLGIHLFYLVGFQNRLLVFIRWGFSFLTHGRGTRLITGEQNMP